MNYNSFDFQQARMKQMLFKSQLRSVLYGVREPDPQFFSASHTPFGVWLHDIGRIKYGQHPEILQLDRALAELLRTAQRLYELYRKGSMEEARASLDQLDPTIEKINQLLLKLENAVSLS